MHTCQWSDARSRIVKYLVPDNKSNVSSIQGSGSTSSLVTLDMH